MGGSMSFLFVALMAAGGGGNELLDFCESKFYWEQQGITPQVETLTEMVAPTQIAAEDEAPPDVSDLIQQLGAAEYKKREAAASKLLLMGERIKPQLEQATEADDVEIALRAKEIIAKLSGEREAWDARRLMAIRTLGEKKSQEALPALRQLLNSDKPFEAEYARRAIAMIEGKDYTSPQVSAAQLASDLALLPKRCGVVGQVRKGVLPAMSMDKLFADLGPMMGGMGGAPGPEQMRREMTKEVAKLVGRIGNVRIDSLTIGVRDDVSDEDDYWVMFVVRGAFDIDAVIRAMDQSPRRPMLEVEGTKIYQPETDVAVAPLSSSRIVIMFGEQEDMLAALLGKRVKAAKAAADGAADAQALTANAAMTKLIETVDRKTSDLWVVSKISESYRQAPVIQDFDTLVLTSRKNESGEVLIHAHGEGSDAEKVKAVVDMMNNQIAEGIKQMEQMAQMMPPAKTMVETLKSIKLESDGTKATGSMKLQSNPAGMMMMPMMFMMSIEPAPAVQMQNVPLGQ